TASASSPAATAAVPQPVTAPAPTGYTELSQSRQAETRNASGKVTVEASTIHVIACHGASEGRQLYIYQYTKRPGFRAIAPPNWGNAAGGGASASLAEAAAAGRAGAGAPAPAAASAAPPAATATIPQPQPARPSVSYTELRKIPQAES